jgi:hypothetical protein
LDEQDVPASNIFFKACRPRAMMHSKRSCPHSIIAESFKPPLPVPPSGPPSERCGGVKLGEFVGDVRQSIRETFLRMLTSGQRLGKMNLN